MNFHHKPDRVLPTNSIYHTLRSQISRISWARTAYLNAIFLKHALRESLWHALFRRASTKKGGDLQQVLTWSTPFDGLDTPERLIAWLRVKQLSFSEGHYAIYLPPQDGLMQLIPEVINFYPPNAGFKILKDFRPPAQANYLTENALAVRAKLTGRPAEQLITANYLYTAEMGPRVWDLCCWQAEAMAYTVFVVQHVVGSVPSEEICQTFLSQLSHLVRNSPLRVLLPEWEHNPEFLCPDCNHNLLQEKATGQAMYVDFQNFGLTNPSDWTQQVVSQAATHFHFGGGRPIRGAKYLYQSVPGIAEQGKRNTLKRWTMLNEILHKMGIDLKGRLVLDVGCNSGMMLRTALIAGAAWGVGWDLPEVVNHAQKLLLSLGVSRFHLQGAQLQPDYSLEQDIPTHLQAMLDESVVFYFSVRQHIGLLKSLQYLPWRVLLYEGHQGETLEDLPALLAPLLGPQIRYKAWSYMADGDSGARPLAVLLRV